MALIEIKVRAGSFFSPDNQSNARVDRLNSSGSACKKAPAPAADQHQVHPGHRLHHLPPHRPVARYEGQIVKRVQEHLARRLPALLFTLCTTFSR